MRLTMLSLLAVVACTNNTGSVKLDPDAVPTDDTGVTSDDTGVTADDTGETQEPDPEPDYSIWQGERIVRYGDCEETLSEEGFALEAEGDWADYYNYAMDECPECDYVYYIEVWPETVCGFGVTQETIRVVDFDGNDASIYYFGRRGLETLADGGDFDGWTIDYRYENQGLDVTGQVEYPEL
ncbi:MAG: hypothetical protein H6739_40975 [Alphaproteobacteria bacterium]|nr:hypothetical protein [Alphaproteobacteria bacterium]